MKETWKPVLGYEGRYEVSNLGNVRAIFLSRRKRTAVPRLLALQHQSGGYPTVNLQPLGAKQKTHLVHNLVLSAFVGPRPDGLVCRHLDGSRTNNELDNLKWGTEQENETDKLAHGRRVMGEAVHTAKVCSSDVIAMRALGSLGSSEIGRRFGVSQDLAWRVINRKTWKHLP